MHSASPELTCCQQQERQYKTFAEHGFVRCHKVQPTDGDRALIKQLCQVLLRSGCIVLASCKGKGTTMVISDQERNLKAHL